MKKFSQFLKYLFRKINIIFNSKLKGEENIF